MYILGINVYHPDVSAVLIRDGQLIAALEEERFRRVKHYAGFPTTAIRRCFEIGGIEGKDLDAVAVSRNPRANLLRKTAFVLSHSPGRALIGDRLRNLRKFQDLKTPLAEALSVTVGKLPKIHNVEHHPAHLASAFFGSPFEEGAVCALDGFGDFVSPSMALGKDNRLKVLEKVCFPHSLGMLYTAVTQYLGFLSYGDEYKVMGLAPYGKRNFVDALSRLVRLKPGGLFELDLKYFRHWSDGVEMQWEDGYPSLGKVFSPELERLLGPARDPLEPLTELHEDIARSLHAVYETCGTTARRLADGNVIGWFQGRMEWGARALGNRSILADPRRVDMRELINAKIKFREKFRPFAPSILEEAIHDYFVNPACDPFMQQVYPVRDEKRHLLPAITHIDGTGRLQTVNRKQNPLYYRLIQEFEKLTGVPVLLNTSFNENEPIVDTPAQALDCFLRTKMDGIVAGDTLILRDATNPNPRLRNSSKNYHIEPVSHR